MASTHDKCQFVVETYVTESKLALLPADQLTEKAVVEAKNRTLFWKLADGAGGRLILQKNHLIWVWMLGSFIEQRVKEMCR